MHLASVALSGMQATRATRVYTRVYPKVCIWKFSTTPVASEHGGIKLNRLEVVAGFCSMVPAAQGGVRWPDWNMSAKVPPTRLAANCKSASAP